MQISTPSPQRKITLVSGADDNYFPGLLGSVLSALWSLDQTAAADVLILDPGLSTENKEALVAKVDEIANRRNSRATCNFRKVDAGLFSRLPALRGVNYMTYARLLLPTLCHAEEAIWIDSDMLIFRDLTEVSCPPDMFMAGCRDTGVKFLKNDTVLSEDSTNCAPYLNAGFLVMNLKLMRQEDFSEGILNFMQEHADDLRFHDQSAINTYCKGRLALIDGDYNYLCAPWYRNNEAVLSKIAVSNIHYLGGDKPWMASTRVSCYARDLLFYHCMETLLGTSQKGELDRVRKQFQAEHYGRHLVGLAFQLETNTNEKTEDRFQTFAELRSAYDGSMEREICFYLQDWANRGQPSQRKKAVAAA